MAQKTIPQQIDEFIADTAELKKQKKSVRDRVKDMREIKNNAVIMGSLSTKKQKDLADAVTSAAQLTRGTSTKKKSTGS